MQEKEARQNIVICKDLLIKLPDAFCFPVIHRRYFLIIAVSACYYKLLPSTYHSSLVTMPAKLQFVIVQQFFRRVPTVPDTAYD